MADQSAPARNAPPSAKPDAAPELKLPDPVELSRIMTRIADQSHRLLSDFLARQTSAKAEPADPLNIGQAFFDMTARIMANPAKLVQAQLSLWSDYMSLWQSTTRKMLGEPSEPVVSASPEDRRFKDSLWDENYVFDFIKHSYLLSARWMQSTVRDVEGLDDKTAKKVDFYTRQFVDAMAPSNFALFNPEVLKRTIESGGENLLKGLSNLLDDLERGKGKLAIKMTKNLNYYSEQFSELKNTISALKRAEAQFSKLFSHESKEDVLKSIETSDSGSIDMENLKQKIKSAVENIREIRDYVHVQHDIYVATPKGFPVDGAISSQFGNRVNPIQGGQDFHSGLDISSSPGDPVSATAEGIVSFSGWNGGSGNLVVLEHGHGFSTF